VSEARTRILVAGAGAFGREHLSRLSVMADVELVGVADRLPAAARDAAARYGVPVWDENARDLVERLRPDGLIVATPADSHVPLATAALARGIPVLVEKPVAPTSAEIVALMEAEARSGTFVLPGHVLRFSAAHRVLVDIVRSGEIGRILSVTSRRFRDDSHAVRYRDIDPVLMTMIHDIDLCVWITGAEAAEVSAVRQPSGTPRSQTVALVRDTKGSAWQLTTAWTYPAESVPADRVEIAGERGSVELEVGSHIRQWGAVDRRIDLASLPQEDALQAELDAFLRCIRTGTRPVAVTTKDAQHGLRAAEAILASLR
jgi:predicted dehydrogenase